VGSFTAQASPSLPVQGQKQSRPIAPDELTGKSPGRSVARLTFGVVEVRVEPITEEQYETLVPMIAAYQGFYEATDIRDERNREFFRRFLAPSEDGLLIGAWRGDELVGYACLYWHFSSTKAVETVLMNDLFVDEGSRGGGVGRALIEAAAAVARERGSPILEWSTAPDNATAQRLYDSTGAERSTWIEYSLLVDTDC
jgi:GNAT superfamily N-acetyltransferase